MKKRIKKKKKFKKKSLKKRKIRAKSKRNGHDKTINLSEIINFKFEKIGKAFESFTKKREKEKLKQDKIKSKESSHSKLFTLLLHL